ncbi:arylmalonate decarboxylase [Haematobacter massiliensis]|uniref:Arylmalonate decarboxylase n=1 Tax=Haematobacter massiliensis TaxID=195105 RepID=A0A086Y260_9RHOB|nr:arylmalonate decarboxylase [Haematobacter massiliensis]KFI28360.1 arylmalonate decarboxylase [Haematobacter massiliensis]OWJ84701.1 ectoine utilization protein EutA [Haematobacter massiliensis]QBJ26335.1 ectoine utilization protein EutA [Haematobacter massiliensis]
MSVLDLPLMLDDCAVPRRIGLVTLATDHTTEVDFAVLPPRGIGVYATRIPFANPVTPETLAAMAGEVTHAAALILPDEELDAVVYSCTSASVVIGDDRVRAAITAGKPGAQAITPISAGFAALRALAAGRITLLTPYTPETTRPMAECFEAAGFALQGVSCLNLTDDREMARLSQDSIMEAARAAFVPGSQALFISCTAVRAAGIAARIEDVLGVPIVTSNLATLWAAMRACGDPGAALPGQLMRQP